MLDLLLGRLYRLVLLLGRLYRLVLLLGLHRVLLGRLVGRLLLLLLLLLLLGCMQVLLRRLLDRCRLPSLRLGHQLWGSNTRRRRGWRGGATL